MGIFIGGSALAALSSSTDSLILARAIQGVGGAIVTPLTLTILSAAMPPERRAVARSARGAASPASPSPIRSARQGAIAEGLGWHWIFWLNVPIGLIVLPMAAFRLTESSGRRAASTSPAWPDQRRTVGPRVGRDQRQRPRLGEHSGRRGLVAGTALLVGFVVWEARSKIRCCR